MVTILQFPTSQISRINELEQYVRNLQSSGMNPEAFFNPKLDIFVGIQHHYTALSYPLLQVVFALRFIPEMPTVRYAS